MSSFSEYSGALQGLLSSWEEDYDVVNVFQKIACLLAPNLKKGIYMN